MAITTTDQFRNGKSAEAVLDEFFRQRGRSIRPTSFAEERIQRLGDRVINGVYVEYKSFDQTAYTGNIFLEFISVDKPFRPGWAIDCVSDYIVAIIRPMGKVLIFRTVDIFTFTVSELGYRRFRIKQTKSQNTYKSSGLVVPLKWAIKHMRPIVINIPA